MRQVHEQIAASVDRVLADEGRKNELRITYVRVLCSLGTMLVDLWLHWSPPAGMSAFPLHNAAVAGSALVAYSMLGGFLFRGHYRNWMPLVLPVVDATFVVIIGEYYWASSLPIEFDYSGAVAVLLAASAGLRFRRDSILITTAAAMYAFIHIQLLIERDLMRIPFVCAIIGGAALLAFWINSLTRRAMTAEVAKHALARFLPPEVVEGAHADPQAMVGPPRHVAATIVVSDIRGFTMLAEAMSPADTLEFLNLLQGRLGEVVWSHGGTVDKFMGDGMLAVFGVAGDSDDHAARALRAANGMLAAIDEINANERAGMPPVQIGIGVHTGEVVAGVMGSHGHLEFTVIGDTVNIASRLEGLTKKLDTPLVVSGATVAAAGSPAEYQPFDELPLRGRTRTIQIFRRGPPS